MACFAHGSRRVGEQLAGVPPAMDNYKGRHAEDLPRLIEAAGGRECITWRGT
jgi:hypothetical protein